MHFAVDEDDDGSSPFGPARSILNFTFWILDFGLRLGPAVRIQINSLIKGDETYVCTKEYSRDRDMNFQLFLVR